MRFTKEISLCQVAEINRQGFSVLYAAAIIFATNKSGQ